MTPQPVTLLNTGLPVAALALLAVLLPALLEPAANRSQRVLAACAGLSAVLLLMAGGVAFGAAYALAGARVRAALGADPWRTGGLFLSLSLTSVIVWGPLLALAWLVRAQGVERRRGEAAAREGRG